MSSLRERSRSSSISSFGPADLQSPLKQKYNIFSRRMQDEWSKNRRWFVANFDIKIRERVMSYLEDDYCTAYHIAELEIEIHHIGELEIEIHHPNLHRARNPHNP